MRQVFFNCLSSNEIYQVNQAVFVENVLFHALHFLINLEARNTMIFI